MEPSVAATDEARNEPRERFQTDLPNFHKVHDFLYRGGEPTDAGLEKLKAMGVKTIIDLRGHQDRCAQESRRAAELNLRYLNLPMSSQSPTPRQIKTFLQEVEEAAHDMEAAPVFVHCAHGSDRTGCMVGIWRVTHDNWSWDKTYKEMRQYYFNPKFTRLSEAVRQAERERP